MGKRLVRVGSCLQCGRCCYMTSLAKAPALARSLSPEVKAFLMTAEGQSIRCRHLDCNEEGKSICKVFGKSDRPAACSLHPSSPNSLTEGCKGYFFYCEEDESPNG
jgi:hypothetical protein